MTHANVRSLADARREKRLKEPMIIRTCRSVYLFSTSDDDGVRTMWRDGSPQPQRVRLLHARVGTSFLARVYLPKASFMIYSSKISSIEPDPDR